MTMQSRPVAFWVALVHGMVDGRFRTALDEHGVTHGQWQALSLLRRGPATHEDIAAATSGHDDADLGELVESGWIVRGERLELTDRGATATAALAEVVEGIGDVLDRVMPPEDARAVADALSRAARELGWTEPEV